MKKRISLTQFGLIFLVAAGLIAILIFLFPLTVKFNIGDCEVLDEPENFRTKEESKLGALEYIFQPELYPDLYADAYHKVRINYYPPRGD